MKFYKTLIKEFLAGFTRIIRKRRNLTQEEIAEQLHITTRSYSDLERGKSCFSAITLIFLLLMLTDEEMNEIIKGFRQIVSRQETEDVA